MASTTHDDGFHEIQLNGKQLVFLFMAVTVVSVVIFLCGVLVGRGVRLERGAAGVEASVPDGSIAPPAPVDAPGSNTQPTAGTADLAYPAQLDATALPPERLGDRETPTAPPADEPVPAPPPAPAPRPAPAVAAAPAEPTGSGVAIQVSAFREQREAAALANRLVTKGYTAYVVDPAAGAPALYRVRVGKFKDRREADRWAARLKKEEQFDPWIVP